MQIEDKIALVTGGASGLGLAYAEELLRNGAGHVVILDLVNSNGEGAAKRLSQEFGQGRASFFVSDVTKLEEFEDSIKHTIDKFGSLDILINNAGIANDAQWELMINVNLNGVIRGTLLGLEYMGTNKNGKGGVIVNVSSILGVTPLSCAPIYVAVKHAIIGLSRSFGMPHHYERTGVRVLSFCPGFTHTPMSASGSKKLLGFIDHAWINRDISVFPFQTVDTVAKSLMLVIRKAENGSVWIAEGGEPAYEILIPDRFSMKINS